MLHFFGLKKSKKEEKVGLKKKHHFRLKSALPEATTVEVQPNLKTECESCLEPHKDLLVLPCQHSFCTACIRGLFQTALKDKELVPVKCCGKRVDQRLRRDVLQLDELDTFEKLLEESDAAQKLYWYASTPQTLFPLFFSNSRSHTSPGRGCSVFYNLDKVQTNSDGAFCCRACNTSICSPCRASHPKLTCAQYNALPLHERAPDDLEFFAVAKQKQYSRCTRCGRFTELVAYNCGTVYCKCGFAYGYTQHRYAGPAAGTGTGTGLGSLFSGAGPAVPTATEEATAPNPYALEEAPCTHEWQGVNRVLDRPRLCHLCRQTKRCFQSYCTKCRLRACAICLKNGIIG